MLLEPAETPFDFRFELARTTVRVSVGFWIFSAILGWDLLRSPAGNGMLLLAIWMACTFVSILLHEFGHIMAGRWFGCDGYIVLYSFGGLAVGSRNQHQRWQRIIVTLAGPGIQLVLWGAMWLLLEYFIKERITTWGIYGSISYYLMMQINWIWPLFNLLPVWPLDGGMVTREVCDGFSPRNGLKISLVISFVVAGFIAFNSYAAMNNRAIIPGLGFGSWYSVILFAMLAFESFQLLQRVNNNPWGGNGWRG